MAGQCPATSADNSTCASGDAEYIPGPNYNDGEDWMCKGSDTTGTDDDVTCETIVGGVCGLATDTCFAGTVSGLPGTQWKCLGSNGGIDKVCPGPDYDYDCGTQENTCLVDGTSYASSATVSSTPAGCSIQTNLTIVDTADDPDMLNWRCQYAISGSCPNGNTVSGSSSLNCEIPASPACTLTDRAWISSCGQGQIGCDGYYETNYDHCIVTNPVDGALYYQDAVGYGVDFLAATPPTPGGQFTVEYTCCTNCDDAGNPITDPDNDCSWPPVTPVTPVVDGVCGAAVGDCDEGDPADVDTNAGTWTCEGTGGGTDTSCPDNGCPPGYYACKPMGDF